MVIDMERFLGMTPLTVLSKSSRKEDNFEGEMVENKDMNLCSSVIQFILC